MDVHPTKNVSIGIDPYPNEDCDGCHCVWLKLKPDPSHLCATRAALPRAGVRRRPGLGSCLEAPVSSGNT